MKEFKFSFQLSKIAILTVCYYKSGENESAEFTISGAEFTISVTVLQREKHDSIMCGHCQEGGAKGDGAVARFVNKFNMCGHCKEEVSKGYGAARLFVDKFNSLHNKCLNETQYNEIVAEIEILKNKYNWIESESFNKIVSMSKLTPKKI